MTDDDGLPTELINAALSTPAVQQFIDEKLRAAVGDALRDAMPVIVESSKEALRSEIQPALDAIARGRATEGTSPPAEGASPSGGGKLSDISMTDIVQMVSMFKGGGGGGGGGTDVVMAQVSSMADMMGQISASVTAPMFSHYNMGFQHALQSFGHFSRADPADREAFTANMPMAQPPQPPQPPQPRNHSSDDEVRRQMGGAQ
jgi:hypothetical protein